MNSSVRSFIPLRTLSPTAPIIIRSTAIARNAANSLECTRAGTRETRATSAPAACAITPLRGARNRFEILGRSSALVIPRGFGASPDPRNQVNEGGSRLHLWLFQKGQEIVLKLLGIEAHSNVLHTQDTASIDDRGQKGVVDVAARCFRRKHAISAGHLPNR